MKQLTNTGRHRIWPVSTPWRLMRALKEAEPNSTYGGSEMCLVEKVSASDELNRIHALGREVWWSQGKLHPEAATTVLKYLDFPQL